MRVLALAAGLLCVSSGVRGQVAIGSVSTGEDVGAVSGRIIRLPALGGAMAGGMKGQPYSLVEKTTTVRLLADGTTITNVEEEHKMRDSEGRQRTETGPVVDGNALVDIVTLVDPVAETITTIIERSKEAHVSHFLQPKPPTPEMEAKMAAMRAKAVAARASTGTRDGTICTCDAPKRQGANVEKLAPKSIGGLYAEGTRTVVVIPVGRVGNDREMKIVAESWRSPDLGIVLEWTRDDPQTGKTTTEVTELERAEPDAALFKVPEGYKVIDQPANQ